LAITAAGRGLQLNVCAVLGEYAAGLSSGLIAEENSLKEAIV
jgi:hypothetical protein